MHFVIPAQTGQQGVKNHFAKAGQQLGFISFVECLFLLNPGLCRNDGLMDKFPQHYLFDFSQGEFANLRLKILIAILSKTRAAPKAFAVKACTFLTRY